MSKRAFLVPLAAALSALAQGANGASADSVLTASQSLTDPQLAGAPTPQIQQPGASDAEEAIVTYGMAGDLFSFVLKRAESGEIVAQHSSHESHSSHSSHRSHYSSSN